MTCRDCSSAIGFTAHARPATEQTIQMDVDPLAVNQMKLNPKPDSGAIEWSGESRPVSLIKITMHFNSVLIKCRFPWLRSGPLDARGPPVTQTSPRWIWAVFNCALVLFSQTVCRGFTQTVCQLKDRRVQTTPQDFKCSASLEGGISRASCWTP